MPHRKGKEPAGTCPQTHCESGCGWQTPPQSLQEHPRGWGQGTRGGDRGALLTLTRCLLAGRFAAKTVTSGSLVLVTLERREGAAAQLTVNSEKMVIGTMLVKDIVQALAQ